MSHDGDNEDGEREEEEEEERGRYQKRAIVRVVVVVVEDESESAGLPRAVISFSSASVARSAFRWRLSNAYLLEMPRRLTSPRAPVLV